MNHDDLLLDKIADEFEAAWSNGRRPGIGEYLRRVEGDLMPKLAELLIPLDIEYRIKAGETVDAGDYSEHGDEVVNIAARALAGSQIREQDLAATMDSDVMPRTPEPRIQDSNASKGLSSTRPLPAGEKSQQIGPYKLLQKLGEGGMGTVWMAEQTVPVKRRVALKVIKAGLDNKQVIARFEAERQALAMMNHENIARILDGGTTETGQPYFVMELVQGIPFTKYCDQNKLSIKDRLELFIPVCKAIQHAHQKGIIHRDLKPSNVLVSLYDGKPVPKVIDFGLAKALEHTTHLTDKTMFTEFGQVVGTLQYMSPEQAEMNQLDIDTRTDIYSLGVMLYELLTGSTPIDAETLKKNAILQVLATIREQDPPRPSVRLSSSTNEAVSGISAQRQIDPSRLKNILRGELDWIVMKSIEKDRSRRYDTANGFAADIENYLSGDVVSARPPSTAYRIQKYVRRHRGLVASLASIMTLLIAGFVGISWFAYKAEKNRQTAEAKTLIAAEAEQLAREAAEKAEQEADEARKQRELARDSREEALRQAKLAEQEAANARRANASNSFQLAQIRWSQNRFGEAKDLLRQVPSDYRDFAWRYSHKLSEGSEHTLVGHQGKLVNVCYTPDGTRVLTTSEDGTLRLWDAHTGYLINSLMWFQVNPELASTKDTFRFSPCGRFVAFSGGKSQNQLSVVSTDDLALVKAIDLDHKYLRDISFSQNGRTLAIVTEEKMNEYTKTEYSHATVSVWETDAWTKQATFSESYLDIYSIVLSPDATLVALNDTIFDSNTGERKFQLERGDSKKGVFSPCGKFFFHADNGTVEALNVYSGDKIKLFEYDFRPLRAMAISPDGMQLALAGDSGNIKIWSLTTFKLLHDLKGHADTVVDMCLSPDGHFLVSASHDATAKIWNLDTPHSMSYIEASELSEVTCVAISPDSTYVAKSNQHGEVQISQAIQNPTVLRWKAHSSRVEAIAWSADGQRLATCCSEEDSVKIWEALTGVLTQEFHCKAERFDHVVLSPDGTAVNVVFEPVWDGLSQQVPFGVESKSFMVNSTDAATEKFEVVEDWREQEKHLLSGVLRSQSGTVKSIARSPDGKNLVTVSYDNTIKVWSSESGLELITLTHQAEQVEDLRFSLDGNAIWAVDPAGNLIIWEVAELWEFEISEDQIKNQVVSPEVVHEIANGESADHLQATRSPDGKWPVISMGNEVGLVDLKNSNQPHEQARRQRSARLKSHWHHERATAAEELNNWYAAVFHRAWLMKADPDDKTTQDSLRAAFEKLSDEYAQNVRELEPVLPAIVREVLADATHGVDSANRLRQIAIAMLDYESVWARFPPASLRSDDHQPLLSWRVLVLPYIGQGELHDEFRLDEPWDSPHNIRLLERMPKQFRCPDRPTDAGYTVYQVPIGPGTIFEGDRSLTFGKITKGLYNTIMIVESDIPVPWTKPEDWSFDPLNPTANLGGIRPMGFNVAMASSEVRLLDRQIDSQDFRSLIYAQWERAWEQDGSLLIVNQSIRAQVVRNLVASVDLNEISRLRELLDKNPDRIAYTTLGMAEYRLGNFPNAINACSKSLKLTPQDRDPHPINLAVIAMSLFSLGNQTEAEKYRQQLVEAMQQEQFKDVEECQSFFQEVENLFAEKGQAKMEEESLDKLPETDANKTTVGERVDDQ